MPARPLGTAGSDGARPPRSSSRCGGAATHRRRRPRRRRTTPLSGADSEPLVQPPHRRLRHPRPVAQRRRRRPWPATTPCWRCSRRISTASRSSLTPTRSRTVDVNGARDRGGSAAIAVISDARGAATSPSRPSCICVRASSAMRSSGLARLLRRAALRAGRRQGRQRRGADRRPQTFIGTCGSGGHTYHVYLPDQRRSLSSSSVGETRRFGERSSMGPARSRSAGRRLAAMRAPRRRPAGRAPSARHAAPS